MNCECDLPKVCEEARRRARKPHDCDECWQWIAPGETYLWIRGLWDGEWSRYTLCLPCVALREEAQRDPDLCECIGLGCLWETLEEAHGEEEVRLVLGERVHPYAFTLPGRTTAMEARP